MKKKEGSENNANPAVRVLTSRNTFNSRVVNKDHWVQQSDLVGQNDARKVA